MAKPRSGSIIICKSCTQEFYVPAYRISSAKFCSLNCQNHIQYERPVFTCAYCAVKFEDSPSRFGKRKFCSITCYFSFKSQRKSCQKEARRLAIKKLREEGKVPKGGLHLRRYVFDNKSAICFLCGYKEHIECLDIHHGDADPNNNSLENLFVLCVMCHRKVHRNIIQISGLEASKKRRRFPRKSDKLDDQKILEIKKHLDEKKLTHKQISVLYGVKRECITKIKSKKRWNHIEII